MRGDGYGGRNSSLNSEENGDGVERERERSSNLRKEKEVWRETKAQRRWDCREIR